VFGVRSIQNHCHAEHARLEPHVTNKPLRTGVTVLVCRNIVHNIVTKISNHIVTVGNYYCCCAKTAKLYLIVTVGRAVRPTTSCGCRSIIIIIIIIILFFFFFLLLRHHHHLHHHSRRRRQWVLAVELSVT